MRRDRFYNFNEKPNVKNLKPRTLQGLMLEQLLLNLVPFCRHFGSIWIVLHTLFDSFWSSDACFSFSRNMFLSTQDRESNVDSRLHHYQSASFLQTWRNFYKCSFPPLRKTDAPLQERFSIVFRYGFANVRLLFCAQVLPFGVCRDSRSAGSIICVKT